MVRPHTKFLSCLIGLVLHASAAGCEGNLDLPDTDIAFQGDLVTLHVESPLIACAGTGPRLERTLRFLVEEFALGEPSRPIDLFWIRQKTYSELDRCPSFSTGCHLRDREVTLLTYVPDEHELVHAYLTAVVEQTPRHAFFEEGLATAYSTSADFRLPQVSVRDGFAFSEGIPREYYGRAGHFVGYMINQFGPADVVQFVLDVGPSVADVERAFMVHFGESLDDFVSRYEVETVGCEPADLKRSFQCDEEPAPWGARTKWSDEITFDCEDESVVGMQNVAFPAGINGTPPPLRSLTYRTIEVTEEHAQWPYSFRMDSSEDAKLDLNAEFRARFRFCGDCQQNFSFTMDKTDHTYGSSMLDPGRYVLTVASTETGPENSLVFRID